MGELRAPPRILCALVALAALAPPGTAGAQIVDSAHNLTAGASGRTPGGAEEICVFCHAPHAQRPQVPMWNRRLPTLTYTLYSSSTLTALPGQPTGASKLCLSCHDGTIALGEVFSRPGLALGVSQFVRGRANLETDLSDDHPISFSYDFALVTRDPELVDPVLLAGEPVKLDADQQMQCTSCHDAHSSPWPKLLVRDAAYSGLCVTCHDKLGWEASAHATSNATWNRSGVDPWPHTDWLSVAENGCQSCHTPHAAGYPERLLVFDTEEENCLSCHDGSVARTQIAAELAKPSAHAVDLTLAVHDPVEDFDTMPRHVECQDCHNPHAATATSASAPFAGGPLALVAGVTAQGARTQIAQYEYEVCFRCHRDNPSLPVARQLPQNDLRLQFDTTNPSYHPVIGPGQSRSVPSLLSPWTEGSYVYCTDCHANDEGPGAQGAGPAGPHGSTWPFLLERQYTMTDGASEDPQRYALCYKCHDRASILNDESFPTHDKHVREYTTACSTCHDPHGVGRSGASSHTHLINFSLDEVSPNAAGELLFEDRGVLAGSCSLSCHGEDHDDAFYPR